MEQTSFFMLNDDKPADHEGIRAANAAIFFVIGRDFHIINVIFDAEVSKNAENDGVSMEITSVYLKIDGKLRENACIFRRNDLNCR